MRQSLSEYRSTAPHPPEPRTRNWPAAARAVQLAVALSAVLVLAAIIDQAGSRSLADHATAMYAPYGKRPDPDLLYGLVYTVAAVGALRHQVSRQYRLCRETQRARASHGVSRSAVMASSTGLRGGTSGNASYRATPGWA